MKDKLDDYLVQWDSEVRSCPYGLKDKYLLIEILTYEEPSSDLLMDTTGGNLRGKQRIFPYAKVLASGKDCKEWGHLVGVRGNLAVLPNRLAKVYQTEAFIRWSNEYKKQKVQGSTTPPAPVEFAGMIIDWQNSYHFPIDRFCDPSKMNKSDAFTFLIPEQFIDADISLYDLRGILKESDMEPEEEIKIDPAITALRHLTESKVPKILPQA